MTKDFRTSRLLPRAQDQQSSLFVKTEPVEMKFRPWQGQIRKVEPQGEQVKITLHNGAEYLIVDQGFKVGEKVQVQPLEGDRYEITHV